MPTDKQRNMGTDETGEINSGGMGTSRERPEHARGGEHGEKRPTNADHDQKIAENRRRMLGDTNNEGKKTKSKIAPVNDDPSPGSADDVLGETKGRKSADSDRERTSGDIVTGREHAHFPDDQAGYDARKENERPPLEANNDLSYLDKGRNDDLSDLDRRDMEPLK